MISAIWDFFAGSCHRFCGPVVAFTLIPVALAPAYAGADPTTTSIAVTPSNPAYGDTLTIKANVDGGNANAEGTVEFYDGIVKLASAAAKTYPVKAISIGADFSCALTFDDHVKCWGNNTRGQLGNNSTSDSLTPVDVSGLTDVIAIDAGRDHACALTSGGGVKCWGANEHGALGDGTTTDRWTPVDVKGLSSGVSAISAGGSFTCALMDTGSLKCWGINTSGQLGDGTNSERWIPFDVIGLGTTALSVSAGGFTTCALTADHGAKCWGNNTYSQIGDGTQTSRTSPTDVSGLTHNVKSIAVGSDHGCAVLSDDTLKCWGVNSAGQLGINSTTSQSSPVSVPGLTGVSHISVQGQSTCAVISSSAYCWGRNREGQLGIGNISDQLVPKLVNGFLKVSDISADDSHVCALTDTGEVRCSGNNSSGELGDGNPIRRLKPTRVTALSAGVASISTGGTHSCTVVASQLKCWGENSSGQLGVGSNQPYFSPVTVSSLSHATAVNGGKNYTCAIDSGAAYCWGNNFYGQLGDGTTTNRFSPTAAVGLSSGVTAISAGYSMACAVKSGQVWCWGKPFSEPSSFIPKLKAGLSNVTSVSVGNTHACVVSQGKVKCWGENSDGQLGNNSTTDSVTPVSVNGISTAISVTAGDFYSCALLTGGAVKCWGFNAFGQLGDGTMLGRKVPVTVSGLSSGVKSIAAGSGTSCAVLTTGAIRCWGDNSEGQVGDGTTTPRLVPTAIYGRGTFTGPVSLGDYHACAMQSSTAVYCWGYNDDGELGDGTAGFKMSPDYVVQLIQKATASFSAAVLSAGDHVLSARYVSSQPDLADSKSADVTVTVDKAASKAVLDLSVSSALPLEPVTLTATVTIPGSNLVPGGPVYFLDGGVEIGAFGLSGGKATLVVSDLSEGTHQLTAVFVGSSNVNPSAASAVATLTISARTGKQARVNKTAKGDQTAPVVAALAKGASVTLWVSADGAGSGIFGQRQDDKGVAVGPEFAVNVTKAGDQVAPDVAGLSYGRFIAVWQGAGIRGRLFSKAGVPGREFGLKTTNVASTPAVAALDKGGFVVAWTETKGAVSLIKAQRFGKTGKPVGAVIAVDVGRRHAGDPDVVALKNGGFAIAFAGHKGLNGDIYLRVFKASGKPAGKTLRVSAAAKTSRSLPALTRQADGSVVIAWTGVDSDLGGIFARRISASGRVAIGAEFAVPSDPKGDQGEPSITAFSSGGFVVSWTSVGGDASGKAILARRFKANGKAADGSVLVNTTVKGDQSASSIAATSDRDWRITWQSPGVDGKGLGIASQRFSLAKPAS